MPMLPFLKPKAVAGVIISQRKPDGSKEPEDKMEGDEDAALSACAVDLIRAIHAKDEAGTASALRAAFQVLESEPHPENTEEQENE